jgi:hypothetical protein
MHVLTVGDRTLGINRVLNFYARGIGVSRANER